MPPKTLTMKRLCLVILLLAAAATSARAGNAGIFWFKDLDKASEAATKTNRPMMIEFWADWCTACRAMDKDIYTDPKLIAAVNGKIVPVRIHFDLQKELAREYNVEALPYIVFANSNGTELLHHRGILNAEQLTAVIKALPADVSELNRLDRALRVDKNDFGSLVAMGRALREAGFLLSSNEYYDRAAAQPAAKQDAGQREFILTEMGLNALDLKEAKRAAQTFETCLKEFPQSPNRPAVLLNLAYSYLLGEQKQKARKSLVTLIEGFPQSEASRKAQVLVKTL